MGKFIRETSSDKFRKLMSTSIASSLILLIVGLVMLFLPDLTNKIIGVIIGATLLVNGTNMVNTLKEMVQNYIHLIWFSE